MDRDRELVPDSWSLVRERTACRAVDKDYDYGLSCKCRDATCWKVLPATLCRDADKDRVMCVQERPQLETQRCSLAGEHCQRQCAEILTRDQ